MTTPTEEYKQQLELASDIIPNTADSAVDIRKREAAAKLSGGYWGYNTMFARQNEDFGGYWQQWDRYPVYDDDLINYNRGYNWFRPFLYIFYFALSPYALIGGCAEYVIMGIASLVDDESAAKFERLEQTYEVTGGPFMVYFQGIGQIFAMPSEIIEEAFWLTYFLIGNFFIHVGYFDWFILQVLGISYKWVFDCLLVVFSNFYYGA